MSRVGNSPVAIPEGVEVDIKGRELAIKGGQGQLSMTCHEAVEVVQDDSVLRVVADVAVKNSSAMAGTTRALVNNMVVGVSVGFERRLQLVGVGYRAQVQDKKIKLTLGFSHPVEYNLPEGVGAETPSQTEIVLKSPNKQLLGQVAAEIRGFRPPEPYKGKGVRYADEYVRRKEAKKK